jgi:serine phosphatase RsbU (regulator of sigma subunit)/DNA-binding NarL/FixJ family response regulator
MPKQEQIRVMLVDDHAVVRRGLAAFLLTCDDIVVVGEADGGEEAIRLCGQLHPDVVLMDLVMPGMNGVETTRAIRERFPQTQIIALTSFREKDLVEGVLQAGAIGYLLKSVPPDEIEKAIRAAHAGRLTIDPDTVQMLILAEGLERLARDIISAPPDASTLPELLRQHVPGLFGYSYLEVRVFPDQILLRDPTTEVEGGDPVWEWLATVSEGRSFLPGAELPWGEHLATNESLIAVPILDLESTGKLHPASIGGIYMARRQDSQTVENLLPAITTLAGQVASALHGAEVYTQTLAQQKIAQELALAWEIQSSFLPSHLPQFPGWQIAATLEPARETSGDFYDAIPLPEGKLGLLIADVADKGIGAALYMALTRTLIRSFALDHPHRPDIVLSAVNHRLLVDTEGQSDLFVTAFYGVLDPDSGELNYCNAGHDPPFLFRAQPSSPEDDSPGVQELPRTGMVLGIEEGRWESASVQLAPGDVLVCYTDGITEAQDPEEVFFGRERLREVVQTAWRSLQGNLARAVQDALVAAVHDFISVGPQRDDITVLCVGREV